MSRILHNYNFSLSNNFYEIVVIFVKIVVLVDPFQPNLANIHLANMNVPRSFSVLSEKLNPSERDGNKNCEFYEDCKNYEN